MASFRPLRATAEGTTADKILAVASRAGVEVEVCAVEKGRNAEQTPCGLPIPELELPGGMRVRHVAGILRRLAESSADCRLLGSTFVEEGQVDSWLEWVTLEIDCGGEQDLNLRSISSKIEGHLKSTEQRYLVGKKLTVADISAVFSLKPHLEGAGLGSFERNFPSMVRWYRGCTDDLKQGSAAAAGGKWAMAAGTQPRYPYAEGRVGGSPEAVYWAWFRKALARRLTVAAKAAGHADAMQEVLATPTAEGVLRTCAEVFGRPLSEAEAAHLQKAPVNAAWLKAVLTDDKDNLKS